MVNDVKDHVQGIQVSAPFGRVKLALQVLQPVLGDRPAPPIVRSEPPLAS